MALLKEEIYMELEVRKEYLVNEYGNWRILKLERINKQLI